MKLTKLIIGTTLILTLSTTLLLLPVGAATTDLQKQHDLLQQQIQQTQSLLNQKKSEESKALQELRQLSNVLTTTDKQLKTTERKLTTTENQLSVLEKETQQTETKLNANTELLGERLKVMYVQGDVHVLEVLFNSTSITDFLTRWDLFSRVAANDSKLIAGVKEDLAKCQEQQRIVASTKETLASLKDDQNVKKHQLNVASSRQKVVVQQVQSEKASVEAALDAQLEESEQIEAELRKLAGEDKNVYGSGILGWPSPGNSRITSLYGMRRHPILKTLRMHTGIDIGAPMGSKVIAADSGKVIEAAYRGANGNMIMINHGNGIVTLYAHLSAFSVKTGDVVMKGQQIGKAGSTGWSTGPHLHFEVRKNGATQNPQYYVKYK